MEIALRDEHGSTRYLYTSGRLVLGEDNEFMGYRGYSKDVTEVRLAIEALEQSEKRFRSIFDNVTDIISTVNEHGVCDYYNRAVEQVLGYSQDEIKTMGIGEIALPEDRELIINAHREAMENPHRVVKATYRCRHKDGSTRVLETTRKRLTQSENSTKELVIHARDITEQYNAEKGLQFFSLCL